MVSKSRYFKIKWEREGRCCNCGGEREPGFTSCGKCMQLARETTRRYRERNPGRDSSPGRTKAVAAGICRSCGVPGKPLVTTRVCADCREIDRRRSIRIKAQIIAKYGGCCKCCGESNLGFLTLDHVNNDGGVLRETGIHGVGSSFYSKLTREPLDDRLQVLCYNCNLGKRSAEGVCPHTLPGYFEDILNRPRYARRWTYAQKRLSDLTPFDKSPARAS